MRRTIRSRCPICDSVIKPVDVNIGIQVMTPCPSCTTLVIVETEAKETEANKEEES
jgi:ribosome-binding protein aMBF1 (putative translation factor)